MSDDGISTYPRRLFSVYLRLYEVFWVQDWPVLFDRCFGIGDTWTVWFAFVGACLCTVQDSFGGVILLFAGPASVEKTAVFMGETHRQWVLDFG